ncbi:tetratricopeptide repeat protein [bacterium]|nr:tetratricopeptide repeat protein [bacterium]
MADFRAKGAAVVAAVLFFLAAATGGLVAQQPANLDAALAALWSGKNAEALVLFSALLERSPNDSDALVGAGFATLRLGRAAEARAYLEKAALLYPTYADAHFGLALIMNQAGDREGAAAAARKALALDPGRKEFQDLAARLTAPPPAPLPPFARPSALQMNFKAEARGGYQVLKGGTWKPFFWKGINLGAALPGRYPSEFPGRATYDEWLKDIGEAGFNLIRVYTIHPPAFYEALADYNEKHAEPLYLVHGVWAELPPEDNFLDPEWYGEWKAEMRRVVDLLHGRADIAPRPGHASGSYRADLSRWTAGIILGREWEPGNVELFNKTHPMKGDFSGRFVTLRKGTPMEAFLADAMEYFMAYEQDAYNAQQPVAFTNWPTLDPLYHLSETTKAEETAWRKKLGLPYAEGRAVLEYDNDSMSLDMQKFDLGKENRAGLFASYHAYPYYPDFLNNDADLASGRDTQGPNNYFAYLKKLVAYHKKHPVVISEFGVPSSRLVAHWQAQGMTHGGMDERKQGEVDARLLGNISESGCAGAVLFAWIDEWFKKNWLVIEFEEPLDRKPKWYNYQDAEENYGLVGYRPGAKGPSALIDGDPSDWRSVPEYLAGNGLSVKLTADEGWLNLGIFWDRSRAFDGLMVGIDTHDTARGDHRLPFGLEAGSEAGLEFAILFQGARAAVFADEPYDLFANRARKLYRSVPNADGRFVMPMTESNRWRIGRDGTIYQPHQQEIGWLREGTQDRASKDFDSMAEWRRGDGFLEARIPWGLLNVTDPSSRAIVSTPEGLPLSREGVPVTDGFRLALVAYRGDAFAGKASLAASAPAPMPAASAAASGSVPSAAAPPAGLPVIGLPPLFAWNTWEEPTWHAFKKEAYYIYRDALAGIRSEPAKR